MLDAVLDLLLGSACAVCARPGRALCPACRPRLPATPTEAMPSPCPPGLAPTVVVGEYGGPLKLLVNAHKEQGRFALAEPLGDLLALAASVHVPPASSRGDAVPGARASPTRVRQATETPGERLRVPQVLLVPVPSRSAVVRRRGHDPLLRVAQRAAARMRGAGVQARVARLLRSARTARDQAGLGAADRARNLAGSMAARPVQVGRSTAGRGGAPPGEEAAPLVVVVDDVVTTGATVREAQRALEEAGVVVDGIAAVAATRRTRRVDQAGAGGRGESGPNRVPDYPFAPAPTSV